MKKRKAVEWVKALRSGDYIQGRGRLVDNGDRFCCLGVACNLSKAALEWKIEEKPSLWSMDGETDVLPKTIQEEFGFFNRVGGLKGGGFIHIKGGEFKSLAEANDGGCSFEEIADYIEKNWKSL